MARAVVGRIAAEDAMVRALGASAGRETADGAGGTGEGARVCTTAGRTGGTIEVADGNLGTEDELGATGAAAAAGFATVGCRTGAGGGLVTSRPMRAMYSATVEH